MSRLPLILLSLVVCLVSSSEYFPGLVLDVCVCVINSLSQVLLITCK